MHGFLQKLMNDTVNERIEPLDKEEWIVEDRDKGIIIAKWQFSAFWDWMESNMRRMFDNIQIEQKVAQIEGCWLKTSLQKVNLRVVGNFDSH